MREQNKQVFVVTVTQMWSRTPSESHSPITKLWCCFHFAVGSSFPQAKRDIVASADSRHLLSNSSLPNFGGPTLKLLKELFRNVGDSQMAVYADVRGLSILPSFW